MHLGGLIDIGGPVVHACRVTDMSVDHCLHVHRFQPADVDFSQHTVGEVKNQSVPLSAM